ncbi:MAG: hypothetical protein CL820_06695 [Croceicoccus sp.]|nr:hypothetical protein [Croceicoccus sp.]MAL25577.1 hypothetical protein [Croceicoccus sp.]|tara:strand:- start:25301 stop:26035 length:735 start_codon:yes stop_codon:yes gene_type:complete
MMRDEQKLRGRHLTLFFHDKRTERERLLRTRLQSAGRAVETLGVDQWRVGDGVAGEDGMELTIRFADRSAWGGGSPAHCFEIDRDLIGDCLAVTIAASPAFVSDFDPVDMLRHQCALALELLDAQAVGVFWSGADCLMGADYFRRMVSVWIDGGAFPALGLTALVREDTGVMRSTGLEFLVGQEVAVLPGEGMEGRDQARLAIRMIDFLVREGPIQQDQTIDVDGFGPVHVQVDANKGHINLYR